MLSGEEVAMMRELHDAQQREDRESIKEIRRRLESKASKTSFDYLLMAKASRALGLDAEGDLEETEGLLRRLDDWVKMNSRPIDEINREKRRELRKGAAFDLSRSGRLLDCIRDICELALGATDEEVATWAFRSRSLAYVAVLAEEYESVSPNVEGLAKIGVLRELIVRHSNLAVGPAEAAIISKYALAGARDEAEAKKIQTFVHHNRVSEGADGVP